MNYPILLIVPTKIDKAGCKDYCRLGSQGVSAKIDSDCAERLQISKFIGAKSATTATNQTDGLRAILIKKVVERMVAATIE